MRLIGIIKLPMPTILDGRTSKDPVYDVIEHVAFEENGHAWGLVQRYERLSAGGEFTTVRITLDRWRRVELGAGANEPPIPLVGNLRSR